MKRYSAPFKKLHKISLGKYLKLHFADIIKVDGESVSIVAAPQKPVSVLVSSHGSSKKKKKKKKHGKEGNEGALRGAKKMRIA